MNKIISYLIPIFLICSICSCKWEKYNYCNIFTLDKKKWETAKKVKNSNAFSLSLSGDEFNNVSTKLSSSGFQKWIPLDDIQIGSGKLILSKSTYITNKHGPIFCKKNESIDGYVPVLVYYPEQNILYLVIADFIL